MMAVRLIFATRVITEAKAHEKGRHCRPFSWADAEAYFFLLPPARL